MQLRRQAPNIEGMRIVGRARLRTALGRRVWRLVKHDGSEFAAKQVTSAADVLSTIAHQHASEAHSRADSRSDSRILSVAGGARAQLWWLTRGPSVRRDRQRTRLLRPRQFHLLVAGFVAVSVMGAWVAATATVPVGEPSGFGLRTRTSLEPEPLASAPRSGNIDSETAQRSDCLAWIAFGGVAVAVPRDATSSAPLQHRSLVRPNAKWVPACANTH